MCKVSGKIKKIRRIRDDGAKAMPTTVVKVTELPKEFGATKSKGAMLVDPVNDLEKELEDVQSKEPLACVKLEGSSACIKTLKAHVKDANAKFAKMVAKTAQSEKDLRSLTFSLDPSH